MAIYVLASSLNPQVSQWLKYILQQLKSMEPAFTDYCMCYNSFPISQYYVLIEKINKFQYMFFINKQPIYIGRVLSIRMSFNAMLENMRTADIMGFTSFKAEFEKLSVVYEQIFSEYETLRKQVS